MDKILKFVARLIGVCIDAAVGRWVTTFVVSGSVGIMGWLTDPAFWFYALLGAAVAGAATMKCLLWFDDWKKRQVPQGSSDDITRAASVPPEPEPTAPKEPGASQDHVPTKSERGGNELPFQAFDTPILEAINYVIENALHSYTSTGPAQRSAFKSLHRLMCDGLLQVIGRETEFGPFQEISKLDCLDLVPREVCIPPSEAAPDGVRFSLMHLPDNNQLSLQEQLQKWAGKTRELQDLYVRSVDLYRHFPKRRGAHRSKGA